MNLLLIHLSFFDDAEIVVGGDSGVDKGGKSHPRSDPPNKTNTRLNCVKFGPLIFRKISENVATRSHISKI